MRTFQTHGFVFNYNSDLSGDVLIRNSEGDGMNVLGEALLEFVAEYVRQQGISYLERASPLEVLGIEK